DEVRGFDSEQRAEPGDVPDPHPASVDEVDDLGRMAEAEHVRCDHPVVPGERVDVALPAQFRAGAELAAVQQHQGITTARFQVAGGEPVHDDGSAVECHLSSCYRVSWQPARARANVST